MLPLAVAALVAAGEEHQQPVGEELGLVRRDALLLDELLDEDAAAGPSGVSASTGSGTMPKSWPSGRPSVRGERALGRVDEVVPDAVRGCPANGMRRIVSGTWW